MVQSKLLLDGLQLWAKDEWGRHMSFGSILVKPIAAMLQTHIPPSKSQSLRPAS